MKTAPAAVQTRSEPQNERCPAMISRRHDFDKCLAPCLHEDANCDCDAVGRRGTLVADPLRAEIVERSAFVRASWSPATELDRQGSGRPVAHELLRFSVPEEAQHLADDTREYPAPETREYRRRKTREYRRRKTRLSA